MRRPSAVLWNTKLVIKISTGIETSNIMEERHDQVFYDANRFWSLTHNSCNDCLNSISWRTKSSIWELKIFLMVVCLLHKKQPFPTHIHSMYSREKKAMKMRNRKYYTLRLGVSVSVLTCWWSVITTLHSFHTLSHLYFKISLSVPLTAYRLSAPLIKLVLINNRSELLHYKPTVISTPWLFHHIWH